MPGNNRRLKFGPTWGDPPKASMPLINAYSTLHSLPPREFPHELRGERDLTDPELTPHLEGFQGYVVGRGDGAMTQTRYHVLRHIQRVQQHLSLDVDDAHLAAFRRWAEEANAICFLTDGSICSPAGGVLLDAEGVSEPGVDVPYPADARQRKSRHDAWLQGQGISVAVGLPPAPGLGEVRLRPASEVARRTLALFLTAVRAESLAARDDEITSAELCGKFLFGWQALSPREREFINDPAPPDEDTVQFVWRYEALFLLQWALELVPDLPFPAAICNVPHVAHLAIENNTPAFIQGARLRPTEQILDALDAHLRLHWAVRQAKLDDRPAPPQVDGGIVQERHYALNWLVQFEDAEWDDVDTPT